MSEGDRPTCRSLLGFLSEYVDGELSEELCQEIENHTAECQNCRVVVDTLRKTVSLYHESSAESADIPIEMRTKLFKTLNLEDYLKREIMEDPVTTLKQFSQPVENKRTQLEPFRPYMLCPNCGEGRLDYNGLLELECPACGISFGGGAGCT